MKTKENKRVYETPLTISELAIVSYSVWIVSVITCKFLSLPARVWIRCVNGGAAITSRQYHVEKL